MCVSVKGLMLSVLLCAASLALSAQTVEEQRRALIDSLNNPSLAEGAGQMLFESKEQEVGEIREDDGKADFTFRWRNVGDKPLTVTLIRTTCSCAAPSYDRKAVSPGQEAVIHITYDPEGRTGRFERRIFVYTDLSATKPTAVLLLTGRVIPSLLPTSDYPVAMGSLLLRRSSLLFYGDRRQEERIECLNGGREPLMLRADGRMLPDYLSVFFEPEIVEPGKITDMVIRFRPELLGNRSLPSKIPVFVEGLQLPPGKRTVDVIFEIKDK